jgi:hypothetical protein
MHVTHSMTRFVVSVGLLSFTHLYHVPREFMKVPAPSSDEAARAEMSQALRDPNFAPRQTAANLPLDKLRGTLTALAR